MRRLVIPPRPTYNPLARPAARILIVSDRPRVLLLGPSCRPDWPNALAQSDAVVHAASWGAALDALRRLAFDLLVVDLANPSLADALPTLSQAYHILDQRDAVGDVVEDVVGLREGV